MRPILATAVAGPLCRVYRTFSLVQYRPIGRTMPYAWDQIAGLLLEFRHGRRLCWSATNDDT